MDLKNRLNEMVEDIMIEDNVWSDKDLPLVIIMPKEASVPKEKKIAPLKPLCIILLLVSMSGLVGCKGVNRLIDGNDNGKPKPVELISSMPNVGETPNFNIPVPAGYRKVVYHGALAVGGSVSITPGAGQILQVFIMDRGNGLWFMLNDQYSEAYWYSYDSVTSTVRYLGSNLTWKEYCIYQYIPS